MVSQLIEEWLVDALIMSRFNYPLISPYEVLGGLQCLHHHLLNKAGMESWWYSFCPGRLYQVFLAIASK